MSSLRSWLLSRTRTTSPVRTRARLAVSTLEGRETPASLFDVTWLGTLSAADNFSAAQGINDLGQVVGNSFVQDANGIPTSEHVFQYNPGGGMTDLGTAGATGAMAWDIGNSGRVTGWVHQGGTLGTGGYWEWAALWDGGTGSTIPGMSSPGMSSVAYGVNDAGVVVGNTSAGWPYGTVGSSAAFK
jgi:probable HAF family extracellular repeat protein